MRATDENAVVGGAKENTDDVIGALEMTTDEGNTSEDVIIGVSDGGSRLVVKGTKLNEGSEEVEIAVDVTEVIRVVETGSLVDREKKDVVGCGVVMAAEAGVLDVTSVGLDSGKSPSAVMIPDPSSSIGEMEIVGGPLLLTPSVDAIGVCIVVSISAMLVNIPVREGICEVICSADDADTNISGVTLTVTSACVLVGAIVLITNAVVGVGIIVGMALSVSEGSKKVSLSI